MSALERAPCKHLVQLLFFNYYAMTLERTSIGTLCPRDDLKRTYRSYFGPSAHSQLDFKRSADGQESRLRELSRTLQCDIAANRETTRRLAAWEERLSQADVVEQDAAIVAARFAAVERAEAALFAAVERIGAREKEVATHEADLIAAETVMRESEPHIRTLVNMQRKEKELRAWEERLAAEENKQRRDEARLSDGHRLLLYEKKNQEAEFNRRVGVDRERIERDNEKCIRSKVDNAVAKRIKAEQKKYAKEKVLYGHEKVDKALAQANAEFATKVDERVQAEIDAQFAEKRDALVAAELQRRAAERGDARMGLLCVVCSTEEITWMFKPCKHAATCVECTEKIFHKHGESHCPICKARITEIDRVYLPH